MPHGTLMVASLQWCSHLICSSISTLEIANWPTLWSENVPGSSLPFFRSFLCFWNTQSNSLCCTKADFFLNLCQFYKGLHQFPHITTEFKVQTEGGPPGGREGWFFISDRAITYLISTVPFSSSSQSALRSKQMELTTVFLHKPNPSQLWFFLLPPYSFCIEALSFHLLKFLYFLQVSVSALSALWKSPKEKLLWSYFARISISC